MLYAKIVTIATKPFWDFQNSRLLSTNFIHSVTFFF